MNWYGRFFGPTGLLAFGFDNVQDGNQNLTIIKTNITGEQENVFVSEFIGLQDIASWVTTKFAGTIL